MGGVDLGLSAGDVNATVRLTTGEHRVKLSAGDLNITLLEGSSVRVTGGVSMGDADADAPLTTRRTGMGSSLIRASRWGRVQSRAVGQRRRPGGALWLRL